MNLYDRIVSGQEKISVVGLGYVGLPIAIAFSTKADVIGFDISTTKVASLNNGVDLTNEVGRERIIESKALFTSNETALRMARFHIVAVPTPINDDKTPNLTPIVEASKIIGRNLVEGSIVVYESTVYPGLTEEICIPLLEQSSGLICGRNFGVGYSPERINPGDALHKFEAITKVVSAIDAETLNVVAKVYELVVQAGVYKAESIKVAEAAKVIENSQRDINIAFMNELSMIFHKIGIDTSAVLEAAKTKWNFLDFTPGLVGGHCIGVDPYYLTYKAGALGINSRIILAGRQTNDNMGKYIAENLIKKLIQENIPLPGARVAILGFTFKENCPDTRNTRVIDIVDEIKDYGVSPIIHDPVADVVEAEHEYGITFSSIDDISNMDAVLLAVKHRQFESLSLKDIEMLYKKGGKKILFDVKGIFPMKDCESAGFSYWSL